MGVQSELFRRLWMKDRAVQINISLEMEGKFIEWKVKRQILPLRTRKIYGRNLLTASNYLYDVIICPYLTRNFWSIELALFEQPWSDIYFSLSLSGIEGTADPIGRILGLWLATLSAGIVLLLGPGFVVQYGSHPSRNFHFFFLVGHCEPNVHLQHKRSKGQPNKTRSFYQTK